MKLVEVHADTWEKEVLKAAKPVVVDFWHPMCGWCLKLNPIFEQLPEKLGDKVKFAKVNVLHSPEDQKLAIGVGVFGTPTMKMFCNGRSIGELVGYRPLDRLVKDVEEILKKKEECIGQSTPLKA